MPNLPMDNYRWYNIFVVKFQMSTHDDGDDNFISYKEYQHWIFPKHNNKRFVSLYALILDSPVEECSGKENPPA